MKTPRSKDVVMQLYRRAMARLNARRQREALVDNRTGWGHLDCQLADWFDQWERYIISTRDELFSELDQYEARKRHARDRARRGSKHRRRA